MSHIILPSITTDDIDLFKKQMDAYLKFSQNIHVDFADGSITPNELLSLNNMAWPAGANIWLHVMAYDPFLYLDQIIKLGPNRVIFPFDISFDNPLMATKLREAGIESGIYLTNQDQFEDAKWQFAHFQEVMIFAGNLGYQGAEANLQLLSLIPKIRQAHRFIDIGWDGGVDATNVKQICNAGANNIVSGHFISGGKNPEENYNKLAAML